MLRKEGSSKPPETMSKPTATVSAKMLGAILKGLLASGLEKSLHNQVLYELGAIFASTVRKNPAEASAWIESFCDRDLTDAEFEVVQTGVLESSS